MGLSSQHLVQVAARYLGECCCLKQSHNDAIVSLALGTSIAQLERPPCAPEFHSNGKSKRNQLLLEPFCLFKKQNNSATFFWIAHWPSSVASFCKESYACSICRLVSARERGGLLFLGHRQSEGTVLINQCTCGRLPNTAKLVFMMVITALLYQAKVPSTQASKFQQPLETNNQGMHVMALIGHWFVLSKCLLKGILPVSTEAPFSHYDRCQMACCSLKNKKII